MRKRQLFLILISLLVVGCGGSGGGGGGDTSLISRFAGLYEGLWTASDDSEGSSFIRIDELGVIDGTIRDDTNDLNGVIAGQVQSNGKVSGTFEYQGSSAVEFTGELKFSNGGNKLGGVLKSGNVETTFTLGLQG